MKKLFLATAVMFAAGTASAKDTWLDCSYENLQGKTNVERIVISETKTIGLTFGTISANNGEDINDKNSPLFSNITLDNGSYQFTVESIVSKISYVISADYSMFSMTYQTVINGVNIGAGNNFTGSCVKR